MAWKGLPRKPPVPGFALPDDGDGVNDILYYETSEHSDSYLRPQLIVAYTTDTPPTVTPSATATHTATPSIPDKVTG